MIIICLIQKFVSIVATQEPIPEKYKAHKLVGNYKGYWEAHIQPDWLLIWRIHGGDRYLVRTGTPADLF